ncbi:hypothetical protein [Pseudomonas sp.]|uniref:hypothetical protein n=1 Tax=Pseudomonas sp. TaxID=306 RepID=UPI0028ACB202|nr:hypothetical protein [Pseudomonas sp.]
MRQNARNLRKNTADLLKILPSETLIAILTGAVPTYLFGRNSEGFDTIVGALLADGALIHYAGCFLLVYLLLPIARRYLRFNTDKRNAFFDGLYHALMEASSGFVTILRVGSGVAMGILALPTAITSVSTFAHYKMLCAMALFCCFTSSVLSFHKRNADKHLYRSRYQNPLLQKVK